MSVCIPVPPALADPVWAQEAVQRIQALFTANLTWLENCYPIARVGKMRDASGGEFRYPQVYSNDPNNKPEYYDVRPNDKLKSYCFFEFNGKYKYDRSEEDIIIPLSIVFWGNLPRIDGRTYDFTAELISDAIRVLFKNSGIDVDDADIEQRPEQIFEKYSFRQEDTQFLMYPYTAFKIDVEVRTLADCPEAFVATNPDACEN